MTSSDRRNAKIHDELTLSVCLILNSFILTNMLDIYANYEEKQMGSYFSPLHFTTNVIVRPKVHFLNLLF